MGGLRRENWKGMNWIRQSTRLAIYLRDECQCSYCGMLIHEASSFSTKVTIDHINSGKGNAPRNLTTACNKCNTSKQDRPLKQFLEELTGGDEDRIRQIVKRLNRITKRSLKKYRLQAKELIGEHGSAKKVVVYAYKQLINQSDAQPEQPGYSDPF